MHFRYYTSVFCVRGLSHLVDDVFETLDQKRIERAALAVQDHLHRFFFRISVLVHASACQCVVSVDNGHHLCGNRDLVAFQSVGIALAVKAFVMPAANFVKILHQRFVGYSVISLTILAPYSVCFLTSSYSSGVSLPGLLITRSSTSSLPRS